MCAVTVATAASSSEGKEARIVMALSTQRKRNALLDLSYSQESAVSASALSLSAGLIYIYVPLTIQLPRL
jgi:hypothetical protein